MKSNFTINDVNLNVPPTDISVTSRRNVGTHEYLRDNASFAFKTRYAYTAYNIVLQFDIDNEEDMLNLVKLSTQLDIYPFCFIKSERLESLIPHTFKSSNGYHIWGIQQFQLVQSFDSPNVVTLVLELLFFNYLPMAKDFYFKHLLIREDAPNTKFSGNNKVEQPKKTIVVVNENNPVAVDKDGNKTSLFNEYFKRDTESRYNEVAKFYTPKVRRIDPSDKEDITKPSDVFISYKEFLPDLPPNHKELLAMTPPQLTILDYSNPQTTGIRPRDYTNRKEGDEEYKSKLYLVERTMVDRNGNKKSCNDHFRAFQSISITRENNFAEHYMSGLHTPTLQYMGKGKTELNIVIEYDIGLNPIAMPVDIDGNPLDFIKFAQMYIESNSIRLRGYDAINNIQIESFLTKLCPSYSFVLNGFSETDTDGNQGIRTSYYNFYGTDTREMLSKRRLDALKNTGEKEKTPTRGGKIKPDPDSRGSLTDNQDGFANKNLSDLEDKIQQGGAYSTTPSSNELGYLAAQSESQSNPGRVSNGAGDHGGKSYGVYQFASGEGVPQQYVAWSSKYGSEFAGLTVNSPAFISKWQEIAIRDPSGFKEDQHAFTKKIYYDVAVRKLENAGYDVSSLGPGAQEIIWSTALHLGAGSDAMLNALEGASNNLTESEFISRVQDYKYDNVRTLFRSSPKLWNGLKNRFVDEKEAALRIGKTAGGPQDPNSTNTQEPLAETTPTDASKVKEDAIQDAFERDIRSFTEDAIPDLLINERLGIANEELKHLNITDSRVLSPFFFLSFNTYYNRNDVLRYYNIIKDNISSEDMLKMTNDELKSRTTEIEKQQQIEKQAIEDAKLYAAEPDGLVEKLISDTFLNLKKFLETEEIRIENRRQNKYAAHAVNTSNVDVQNAEYFDDDIFKIIENEEVDPFNQTHQAIYQSKDMAAPIESGLDLAFPTIKVYLVRSNDIDSLSNFTNRPNEFYELKGVVEVDLITNDDDSPIDYFEMTIDNPGSCYTDESVIYNDYHNTRDNRRSGTTGESNIEIDQIRLSVGTRLHVRAGYGNDINALETVFNGVVTSVEPFNQTETTLRIAAESFGRELLSQQYAEDMQDEFFWSSDTIEVISTLLFTKEIEHFGEWKVGNNDPENNFGFFTRPWYKSHVLTNIYILNINDDDFSAGLTGIDHWFGGRQNEYSFNLYKLTPWEGLKEMEFRHPGLLAKPIMYGDRMSFFFGMKEQLCLRKDLSYALQKADDVDGIHVPYTNIVLDDIINPPSDSLYEQTRHTRFRPACNFHIFTSDNNIIFDGLKLTSDFYTEVNVKYWTELSQVDEEDEDNPQSGSIDKDREFSYRKMKLDDTIRPADTRTCEFISVGADGEYMAVRYGSVFLRKEVERMYDGQIILIGNASIKAGDYAALLDDNRGLSGFIKIRECKHSWSKDQGYVTIITPGCAAEEYMIDYSYLFERLFSASSLAYGIKVRPNFIQHNESNAGMYSIANTLYKESAQDQSEASDIPAVVGTGTWLAGGYKFVRNPITATIWVAVGVAMLVGLSPIYENFVNSRQPVRLFPLYLNNNAYIGGISGFQTATFGDDFWIKMGMAGESISNAIMSSGAPGVSLSL